MHSDSPLQCIPKKRDTALTSVGQPMRRAIFPSCSTSVFPWKSGLPLRSSPKMHPALHMSTSVPYCSAPSKISGGLHG